MLTSGVANSNCAVSVKAHGILPSSDIEINVTNAARSRGRKKNIIVPEQNNRAFMFPSVANVSLSCGRILMQFADGYIPL